MRLRLRPLLGALDRDRREQRLRVRMRRALVDLIATPTSTILPRYMTATRSETCRTIERSWATKRYVEPELALQDSKRLTTCARIETSSAETGSSRIRSSWVQRQGARDADSLPLTAGELVREAVRVLRAQPNRPQQLGDATVSLVPTAGDAVDLEWLADDVANGHAWIQRRVRILEDDLQLTADRAHLLPLEARDVATVDDDRARGRLDQLENGARERGLTTPGLADEPERLALPDLEIDAVDRVHVAHRPLEQALPDRKVLDEVLDAENRAVGRLRPWRRRAGFELAGRARTLGHAAPTSFDL